MGRDNEKKPWDGTFGGYDPADNEESLGAETTREVVERMRKAGERYQDYRERFQAYSDSELIAAFNGDVRNAGWVGRRGFFLAALRDEFLARNIDLSAIEPPREGMSMMHKIRLVGKRVEVVD